MISAASFCPLSCWRERYRLGALSRCPAVPLTLTSRLSDCPFCPAGLLRHGRRGHDRIGTIDVCFQKAVALAAAFSCLRHLTRRSCLAEVAADAAEFVRLLPVRGRGHHGTLPAVPQLAGGVQGDQKKSKANDTREFKFQNSEGVPRARDVAPRLRDGERPCRATTRAAFSEAASLRARISAASSGVCVIPRTRCARIF